MADIHQISNYLSSLNYQLASSEPSENTEIQPWGSSRAHRSTAQAKARTTNKPPNPKKEIFCLSNRSDQDILREQHEKRNSNMQDENASQIRTKRFGNKLMMPEKPATASYSYRRRAQGIKRALNKTGISQQISNLGLVPSEQFASDEFEDNLESINFYPQFRTSVQQRKNILFLQPHMKSMGNRNVHNKTYMSSFQGLNNLKNQIYQSIKNAQASNAVMEQCQFCKQKTSPLNEAIEIDKSNVIEVPKPIAVSSKLNRGKKNKELKGNNHCQCYVLSHRSVIEYLTEYDGSGESNRASFNNNKVGSNSNDQKDGRAIQSNWQGSHYYSNRNKRHIKHNSISVLKEKLKHQYKDSKYLNNLERIRNGDGLPITVLQ